MRYEELNEVRMLKKQIEQEKQKLSALRSCVVNITAAIDGQPKVKIANSRIETLAILITDTEKRIIELQGRLSEAVPELTAKIIAVAEDTIEQTLLIHRYVSCRHFRELSNLLGLSERRVYQLHKKFLQKISVHFS